MDKAVSTGSDDTVVVERVLAEGVDRLGNSSPGGDDDGGVGSRVTKLDVETEGVVSADVRLKAAARDVLADGDVDATALEGASSKRVGVDTLRGGNRGGGSVASGHKVASKVDVNVTAVERGHAEDEAAKVVGADRGRVDDVQVVVEVSVGTDGVTGDGARGDRDDVLDGGRDGGRGLDGRATGNVDLGKDTVGDSVSKNAGVDIDATVFAGGNLGTRNLEDRTSSGGERGDRMADAVIEHDDGVLGDRGGDDLLVVTRKTRGGEGRAGTGDEGGLDDELNELSLGLGLDDDEDGCSESALDDEGLLVSKRELLGAVSAEGRCDLSAVVGDIEDTVGKGSWGDVDDNLDAAVAEIKVGGVELVKHTTDKDVVDSVVVDELCSLGLSVLEVVVTRTEDDVSESRCGKDISDALKVVAASDARGEGSGGSVVDEIVSGKDNKDRDVKALID
mmetsp:Transcript_33130/g.55814  ORF Transcript_33130/g.55814 Transcript_33130/m.55814 type:complete len:449 (-) Transcript_33130:546-1892(-)